MSNKNSDGRQTYIHRGRQTETGGLFFRTLAVMKHRENIKVLSLRSGSKKSKPFLILIPPLIFSATNRPSLVFLGKK